MNRDRLLHLITVLQGVEDQRKAFSMSAWFASVSELLAGGFEVLNGELHDCGTACCAFGYAALDPHFNALGLTLSHSTEPYFAGHYGYAAAGRFFDLDFVNTRFLFARHEYDRHGPILPRDVIAHIQEVLS